MKSGTVYLEEDCDALKLFKLLKEKNVMVNVTDGGVDENLTNGKVRLSSRALAMNHGVQYWDIFHGILKTLTRSYGIVTVMERLPSI